MKRIRRIGMILFLSCFQTGCFTSLSQLAVSDGGAGSYSGCGTLEMLCLFSLDVLTSPIQAPFLIDIGIAEYCVPPFYRHCRWKERCDQCEESLGKDFSVVLRDTRYLKRYHRDGWQTVKSAALSKYLKSPYDCRQLSPEEARYVANVSLTHPEFFDDFAAVWESDHIDADLRTQALAVLRRRGERHSDRYRNVLKSYRMTITNLQQIVEGEIADEGAEEALDLLAERLNGRRITKKRKIVQKTEIDENIRDLSNTALSYFQSRTPDGIQRFNASSLELPGFRVRVLKLLEQQGLKACSPENLEKVLKYELERCVDWLHPEDCLVPILERYPLKRELLREIRPKVLSVAMALQDRAMARRLVRAFCGNAGQDDMECVVSYYDPQLAWLRAEVLETECPELTAEARTELQHALRHVHSGYWSRQNCPEELQKLDAILRRCQPKCIPAVWFVALTHENDLARLKRLSYFLNKEPDVEVILSRRQFAYKITVPAR